ncbi:MAG: hypothetical protein PHR24_00425 [Oscillospiraceae bacterium]|nr:hypothetical protein [Oscillospiraceae bacterium]MDD3832325.1 hypothetical protein [Oscillospiraceae bacterium]MDD4545742.1 hypothetical protein [Oscillospiraceae bacterium]
MIFYLVLVLGIGAYDIICLKKKQIKKDVVIYISLMALATVLGIVYFLQTDEKSLAGYILNLINIEW